ncbi:CTD kinase subunit gamma CTK3-domain-containing protein [Xylariaceae sp. FL0594]|nr:CTD kinase subunit gamma CTK3-domain-containing protein [Xylariaceae sp. FL0594]
MADPFEVRMRFSSQLQHLNASTTSAQKAAQYALKYKDMDEDLHSCILEQLEKTNMNTRANIMYFIEHLLEMAAKERGNEYVRMMQRDIIRVVDAVCPENGSGAANIKVVRKVLQGLRSKCILLDQTVSELESCLKERDTAAHDFSLSSPIAGGDEQATGRSTDTAEFDSSKTEFWERMGGQGQQGGARKNDGASAANMKPTKKQIEQRIEEDRERHKRMRESMWVVPPNTIDQARKFFAETSDLGEDDRILGEEERSEFHLRLRLDRHVCRHEAKRVRNVNGKRPRDGERIHEHERAMERGREREQERDRDRDRERERGRERPGSSRRTNGVAHHP